MSSQNLHNKFNFDLKHFRQNVYISHESYTFTIKPYSVLWVTLLPLNEIGLKLSAKSCSLKVNKPFSLFIFTVPLR